jgi:hypothetical protein
MTFVGHSSTLVCLRLFTLTTSRPALIELLTVTSGVIPEWYVPWRSKSQVQGA